MLATSPRPDNLGCGQVPEFCCIRGAARWTFDESSLLRRGMCSLWSGFSFVVLMQMFIPSLKVVRVHIQVFVQVFSFKFFEFKFISNSSSSHFSRLFEFIFKFSFKFFVQVFRIQVHPISQGCSSSYSSFRSSFSFKFFEFKFIPFLKVVRVHIQVFVQVFRSSFSNSSPNPKPKTQNEFKSQPKTQNTKRIQVPTQNTKHKTNSSPNPKHKFAKSSGGGGCNMYSKFAKCVAHLAKAGYS